MICSGYLSSALESADAHRIIVDRVVRNIESRINPTSYDGIVFRGVSGALLAPVVAYRLGKPMAVVRRDKDESTHACALVEVNSDMKRYLIVDDFISSGNTVNAIEEVCREFQEMECVGVVCWCPDTHSWSQIRPAPPREDGVTDEVWKKFLFDWTIRTPADENIFWLDHDRSVPVYCCPATPKP
jgi:adenine/guanine phosphoribosyltransferase-like PRPP-binding protein